MIIDRGPNPNFGSCGVADRTDCSDNQITQHTVQRTSGNEMGEIHEKDGNRTSQFLTHKPVIILGGSAPENTDVVMETWEEVLLKIHMCDVLSWRHMLPWRHMCCHGDQYACRHDDQPINHTN